jgi:TolB-like protein
VGRHSDRFHREALAIAALNHPNVCTLYDVGDDYLVMEFLEGKPLKGPLSPETAIRYGLQVCSALEAAHGRGVIHRDLKPANILLTKSGVKLLDFGLAADVSAANDTRTALTGVGVILGTAAYMSPEQADGRPADQRADLFSLGVVIYELLTGACPFQRETPMGSIAAVLRDPAPPLPPDVPSALRSVVERCLEKDPSHRFASASELATSLSAIRLDAVETTSIAVLPFENLSTRDEDQYFVDGLSHDLIHALSRVEGLKVAGRSGAFRFRPGTHDLKDVGQHLGVGHILEGAVRIAGERLRVTVSLVHVADGYVLWSDRFDKAIKDIFEIQDEVCAAIVQALKARFASGKIYTPPRTTRNLAAYDAYLKGMFHLNRLMPSELRRGAALLEEATRADPEFTLALVGLSTYYSTVAVQGHAPSGAVLSRAEELARRALLVDPELAEGHRASGLALMFQWHWAAAEAAEERSLALRPSYAQPYGDLAFEKSLRGQPDAALGAAEQAVSLEPLDPMFGWFLTQSLCMAGEFERAVDQGHATIALDPTYLPTYWWVSMAKWRLGQRTEAVETLAPTLIAQDPLVLSLHASMVGQLGRTDEARAIAVGLEGRRNAGHVAGAALVGAWGGAGNLTRALEWLDTSFQEQDASLILLRAPWFDPLRGEPKFTAILRNIGLEPPS